MRIEFAAVIEAKRLARHEVKAHLRKEGRVKPQYLAHKVIVALANEWLAAHPALYSEARERVQGWLAGTNVKT